MSKNQHLLIEIKFSVISHALPYIQALFLREGGKGLGTHSACSATVHCIACPLILGTHTQVLEFMGEYRGHLPPPPLSQRDMRCFSTVFNHLILVFYHTFVKSANFYADDRQTNQLRYPLLCMHTCRIKIGTNKNKKQLKIEAKAMVIK